MTAQDAEQAEKQSTRDHDTYNALVDLAREAFERGDGWFEAEIDQRSTGSLQPYGATGLDLGDSLPVTMRGGRASTSRGPRSDPLSRIEDVGWRLHTAQYVYVQLGEESRDKWLSSGQRVAIKGSIVGIYLFQRS